MYPREQSFLVLGLSKSGAAAADFLLKKGAKTYVYDDIEGSGVQKARLALIKNGAIAVKREDLYALSEKCDALVLSPGIAIDHPIAVAFKRNKKAVIGESEIAARYLRSTLIAVTGTNGKTTSVSMLTALLCEGGYKATACGNIGYPMILCADEGAEHVAVAEISSFQLETLTSLLPHIAVVLNLTEDHLNRHYNMENYVYLKSRLLKNMRESEYAVLNYDDKIVKGFAEKTKAKIIWFSMKEKVDGAYLEDNRLCFRGESVLCADDLALKEPHNVQNALAVVACAKLMGIDNGTIGKSLKAFKGVPHRIESVGEVCGAEYVDDSKSTNADAAIKAAESMQKDTLLLLGGKDKGYDYTPLFLALKGTKVRWCVLYGENGVKIMQGALKAEYKTFTLTQTFDQALSIARTFAKKGECVLLSPASASFDEFSSYEERGEYFVERVRVWQKEEREKNVQDDGRVAEEYAEENADGRDEGE